METYFTFPDGGLRYDCAACRQRCCRGKGFALGGDELITLVARAPSLAAHVGLRAGGSFAAVDLTDGCWFLAGDGNCAIEVEHGRAWKPSTCRLFPFNRVFRAGDVRVVDVNSVLCPVEAAGGGGVTWAELTREIDELAGSGLVDTPAHAPPELGADWLAIEKRATEAAREHAADPDALLTALGGSIDHNLVAWARLYSVDSAELRALEAAVAPRVALLAPSLRWNTLFRKQAAPWPRALASLPRRLRALNFLAALAARALGGAAPSLRGLSELWQSQSDLLDVLARWNDPVRLSAPDFGADVPAALHGALGRLLAGAFRGGRTLGELVEDAASTLPSPARPLAVALAASQLATLLP